MTSLNLLRSIEDFGQSIAKDYANVRLVPRGTPVFFDQNLRGTIRFAARRGNFLPVIAPQNSSEVADTVVPPTNQLVLSRVTSGFAVMGAVISLGPGRELAKIADIDETTGDVVTEDDMIGTHPAGEPVDLYGVPIETIGSYAANSTVIQIRSSFTVMIGDQIAIDTTKGLLNSTVSTRVTGAQFLGSTIDGRRNYQVTLAQGIARSLVNEEEILLRAQPGYESTSARLNIRGPFVLDFISGPFFEQTVVDEYLNVQLQNSLGDPLTGFTTPVSLGKNIPVANMSIPNEAMLFWQVLAGEVQFTSGRFTAVTDQNGRFAVTKELVPPFPAGIEWDIPILAQDTALVRVAFLPNGYRTYSLGASTPTRITVGAGTSEQPAGRIEVAIQTQRPGVRVVFNDWVTTTSSAAQMSYQMTSTAFGNNEWQAGSLMLKPYFFTLDDIRARHDFTAYNQGVVHF